MPLSCFPLNCSLVQIILYSCEGLFILPRNSLIRDYGAYLPSVGAPCFFISEKPNNKTEINNSAVSPAFPLGPLVPLGDNYCTAVLYRHIKHLALHPP